MIIQIAKKKRYPPIMPKHYKHVRLDMSSHIRSRAIETSLDHNHKYPENEIESDSRSRAAFTKSNSSQIDSLHRSICLDGWSGSGKTSLARELSARLNFPVVHTGMFYRAVTAAALQAGSFLSGSLPPIVANVLSQATTWAMCVTYNKPGILKYDELWTERVSGTVSDIAKIPAVRSALIKAFRNYARLSGPVIFEGRDTGSNIAPEARLKVFLACQPTVRLQRVDDPIDCLNRDMRDMKFLSEACQPLPDAVIIDTENVDILSAAGQLIEKYFEFIGVESRLKLSHFGCNSR